MVTLSERVAAARAKAERETYDRLAHLLADARCSELDGVLVTDAEIGMAQLRWLNTGPVEASAAAVKTEVAKLLFLRGLDAHTLDLPVLPAERRRFLAAVPPLVDGEAGPPGTAPPLPDRTDRAGAVRGPGQIGGGGSGSPVARGWLCLVCRFGVHPSTTSTALPDHVQLGSWLELIDTRLSRSQIPT